MMCACGYGVMEVMVVMGVMVIVRLSLAHRGLLMLALCILIRCILPCTCDDRAFTLISPPPTLPPTLPLSVRMSFTDSSTVWRCQGDGNNFRIGRHLQLPRWFQGCVRRCYAHMWKRWELEWRPVDMQRYVSNVLASKPHMCPCFYCYF